MALLTLAAFSAISGVLILLAFKATSNRRGLAAGRRQSPSPPPRLPHGSAAAAGLRRDLRGADSLGLQGNFESAGADGGPPQSPCALAGHPPVRRRSPPDSAIARAAFRVDGPVCGAAAARLFRSGDPAVFCMGSHGRHLGPCSPGARRYRDPDSAYERSRRAPAAGFARLAGGGIAAGARRERGPGELAVAR